MLFQAGQLCFFWMDRLIHGQTIQALAPNLVQAVGAERDQALANKQRIRDITGPLSIQAIVQYLHLWPMIRDIQLRAEVEDQIRWRRTASMQYTTKSTYDMLLCGSTKLA